MKNRLATQTALLLVSLLAAWPLLQYGPPLQAEAITDGPNHLYRFALLNWHIQHGDYYPRWFSDVYYGFGAPVLNFYAPLSYYILVGIHLVVASLPAAFMLGFVLAVSAAVWGMYYWVNEQFASPAAALTAAAAYSLTPYTYFTILDRAAYPEMWGLAIAPWLFWLALHFIRRPSRGPGIALTVLYASFILAHNLSALLFTPMLLIYGAVAASQPTGTTARTTRSALPALGLLLAQGACIAAFFLVPFLGEAQYVQLRRTGDYTPSASFSPAADLFSAPVPFDPGHVVHPRPLSVPWPQLGLALAALAVAAVWGRDRAWLPPIVVHSLLAAWLIFMNLGLSLPVWNLLPFASLIQFPFRLLGPAMLLLAWLAGAFVAQLPGQSFQRPFSWAAIAAFFFFTLTWTYHAAFDRFPDEIRPPDIIRDEIAHPTRLGTTNLQEFLPRWVSELPSSGTILPRYTGELTPSRLAPLPSTVTLLEEHAALTQTDLTYDSPEPFSASFDIFYFPGWAATLDGQPILIQISQPNGLITIDLPAGRHSLRLARQPTAPQIAGSAVSLLALLALFFWRPGPAAPAPEPGPDSTEGIPASSGLVIAGLIMLRLVLLDRIETPFYHNGLNSIPHPLSVNFDNQLSLVGFDLPQGPTFTSGSAIPMDLFWRAVAPLNTDYHTSIQLVDQYGNHFGQSDHQHPAGIPTSHWKSDQYARDEHQLVSFPGTPPGEYRLVISVFAAAPLNIRNAEGTPGGVEYDLGPVTVTRDRPQPAGPLRLVDSSIAVQTLGVGDRLQFTVRWNSGDTPAPDLSAKLTLTNTAGQSIFAATWPPAGPEYTSDRWTPDELIVYPHSVDLPADLPAGQVRLSLTFVHSDGSPASVSFDLGAVTITVPERSFDIPPVSHRVDRDFGNAIRLVGYDLAPETVILYWQSLQPVSTRLTVFVHNFDASGTFVGGQDGPPLRPTTSWLPGEVITDVHQFSAGEHFEIGLYDPTTGERLGEPYQVTK